MKLRNFLMVAIAVAFAIDSFAISGELLDWGNGPVQFLMSKEETTQWKALRTDEEAVAFIALFWARRDPTPDTPRNEFREQFEGRVAWADKNLQAGEPVRGALTDRGKALLLYGSPKRILRSAGERTGVLSDFNRDLQDTQRETREWVEWIYEDDPRVTATFGVPRASIRFVDKFGSNEYKVERGSLDLAAAQQRAIAASIAQPQLTEAPRFAAPAAAVQTAEPAPQPATELTTEALKAAVAGYTAPKGAAGVTWGEYITGAGDYFVPVMLYIPRSAGLQAGQDVTFFGSVSDASGKSVTTFETPAKLVESKGDLFVDHVFDALPAGKYRGVFGVASAGSPVALAAADMELAGTIEDDAAGVSQLILSNNIYPLPAAQEPTEPFAFGGLKVVPKGDRAFRPADDLWFFVELRNPGVAERALPQDVVPVSGTVAPAPVVQVKLELDGVDASGQKVRRASPPREVQPVAVAGVPGHYAVGDSIPLESFKPGQYTLHVKLIDTVRKTSYTLSEPFRIVE